MRWLPVGLAGLVAAAFPAVAGATDYCVAPNTTCDGPNNLQTFEQALALADDATDADRVFLGAATYTAPDAGGFGYYQSNGSVEIVGQGAGQTILTSPAPGGDGVVTLIGAAGTSIHDLTIRLPQNAVSGLAGLFTKNTARRIEVIEDPTQANPRQGVDLVDGGMLEDSSVTLGSTSETRAVRFGPGGGAVRRSALSAWTGVLSQNGGTIERSRLTGADSGVLGKGNVTTIKGSLIRLTAVSSTGILALTSSGAHTTVNADGVTIIGPGVPNTFGAGVGNESAPAESADLSLTNSIIRGVSVPLGADVGGTGHGTISASYSDYDPSGNVNVGGNASITEANVSNVGDAGFVDAAGGDYHLLPGSPLIDTGDPATPQGLDLDGNPLVADGNGDGSAHRDMGAFELQPATAGGGQPGTGAGQGPTADLQAPLVSGFVSTNKVFAVGRARTAISASAARGTRFRYTLSEPARVTITIQRALKGRYRTVGKLTRNGRQGANSTRFTGRIGRRALRPGRYRAVARATDAAQNRSAPSRARFRIAAR